MSVGEQVDALTLMLDGAVDENGPFPIDRYNVKRLENYGIADPASRIQQNLEYVSWAEVAEAILELEGLADCDFLSWPIEVLSGAAYKKACRRKRVSPSWVHVECYLEGAALLRDGWRPRWWFFRLMCDKEIARISPRSLNKNKDVHD